MITYKYKLYKTKHTRHLDNILSEARFVWNHALALQKRYYRLYNAYIPSNRMQRHFAKHVKRTYMHSQSAQEVLQRLDAAYNRFFKHLSKRPPKFKRNGEFVSFVFKQGGFSLSGNTFVLNSVKKSYRFSYSRTYEGKIRQVRLKRSHKGEWYIYVITDAEPVRIAKTHDGASIGIDFGLKTYMTLSDGTKVGNPLFLKASIRRLRSLSRKHSLKKAGSNNRERSRLRLASFHEDIANRRSDFQWKLAHDLCRRYDYIFLEDLSLKGMTRLWGRKMHDLAHGRFVEILSQVSAKYGCVVHKINRYYPSSRMCDCGYRNNGLRLSDREWVCPECGQIHDRDLNAANNILRRGIYELTSERKTVDNACCHGSHAI